MPDITPNAPNEFAEFDGEFEHIKHHRNLEAAVEAGGSFTGSVQAAQIASGGATVGTSSTAAPIKGFYRTAAPIAISVPAITMLGVTTVNVVNTFSIGAQLGISAAVGDAVILVPTTATPTNVGIGGARVSDTNSIEVAFLGRTAATTTATFTVHVYVVDMT